ncbi:MAG: DUF2344 domain-containing protein [Eggerthellaceae bacterium]|nr:DUF2344 domain-containing protein [Eggerthellaceae bacterium]
MSPLQNTEKLYAILQAPRKNQPQDTFRLRVCFAKRGRAAYLSHLEVAHALERVVRRAALPYAITQGFSPHMKIAFGAALPVGVGGERELFDVYLTSYIPPEEAHLALRDASVPDLFIVSCEYIERSAPAASNAYPVSLYEARIDGELSGPLMAPPFITITRKGKEKVLSVPDYLVAGPKIEGDSIQFALLAREEGSMRPNALLDAMLADEVGVRVRSLTRIHQLSDPYALPF